MSVPFRRLAALSVMAALALAGCGGPPKEEGKPADLMIMKTPAIDPNLKAKVPTAMRKTGVIKVGVDPTYEPMEFLSGDGETSVGASIDLFEAVAAKMGLRVVWVQAKNFGAIIPSVESGKVDVGVSSFTITQERLDEVDMVSYYLAGTRWMVPKGNPAEVDPDNACGLIVAVQKDTVQDDDVTKRSAACPDNHQIEIKRLLGADQALSTMASGEADALLSDSPVVDYAVANSDIGMAALGRQYADEPYGIVLTKENRPLALAVLDAVEDLKKDGTYDAILKKWGIQSGSISDFALNPKP